MQIAPRHLHRLLLRIYLALAIALVLLPGHTAHAGDPPRVMHVIIGGTGTADGSSWDNASRTLYDAIDLINAAPGTFDEIWLAGGEYWPAVQFNPCGFSFDSSDTFFLPDGVALRGGFVGTEASLADRLPADDPNAPVSVLSGDPDCNDGPDITSRYDNAYHVVTALGHTQPVEIDRVTITGGQTGFELGRSEYGRGAGLLAEAPGLVLTDIVFRGNGIADSQLNNGSIALPSFGGAVGFRPNADGTCHVEVRGCLFEGNEVARYPDSPDSGIGNGPVTAYGGALGILIDRPVHVTVSIRDSVFRNNRVRDGAGGATPFNTADELGTRGGAIAISRPAKSTTGGAEHLDLPLDIAITNTVFESNFAESSRGMVVGGAVYVAEPYRLDAPGRATATFARCDFSTNATVRADNSGTTEFRGACGGGAIFMRSNASLDFTPDTHDRLIIRDCQFSNNFTDTASEVTFIGGSGGAILTRSIVDLDIENSTFAGNHVYQSAPELTSREIPYVGGGAIAGRPVGGVGEATARIVNSTFTGNRIALTSLSVNRSSNGAFPLVSSINGGAITLSQHIGLIRGCAFTDNGVSLDPTSDSGKLIFSLRSFLGITGGAVAFSRATQPSRSHPLSELPVAIEDCQFTSSTVRLLGPATEIELRGFVRPDESQAQVGGAHLDLAGRSFEVRRCTFTNASTAVYADTGFGAPLRVFGSLRTQADEVLIEDCLFDGDTITVQSDDSYANKSVFGTIGMVGDEFVTTPTRLDIVSTVIRNASVTSDGIGEATRAPVVASAVGVLAEPETRMRVINSAAYANTADDAPAIGAAPAPEPIGGRPTPGTRADDWQRVREVPPPDPIVLTLINATVAGNTSASGVTAGVLVAPPPDTRGISMLNTVVWGNAASGDASTLASQVAPTPEEDARGYSTIAGWEGPADNGMSADDPLFADPSILDFTLAAGSPAIDSGDNSALLTAIPSIGVDARGAPRFINDPSIPDAGLGPGPVVDRGAFEFQSLCAADLAEPFGLLDIDDVLTFISAFADENPSADLREPFGTFDIDDVLAFLASFASGCP